MNIFSYMYIGMQLHTLLYCIYLEVEMLNYMVGFYPTSVDNSKTFSKVVLLIYTSTSSLLNFPLLHILNALDIDSLISTYFGSWFSFSEWPVHFYKFGAIWIWPISKGIIVGQISLHFFAHFSWVCFFFLLIFRRSSYWLNFNYLWVIYYKYLCTVFGSPFHSMSFEKWKCLNFTVQFSITFFPLWLCVLFATSFLASHHAYVLL